MDTHAKACDRMELTALGEQQEYDVGRAVRAMLLDTPESPVRQLLERGSNALDGGEVQWQATDTSRTKLSLLRFSQVLFPDMAPSEFARSVTTVGGEANYIVTPYHGHSWHCERVKQLLKACFTSEQCQRKVEEPAVLMRESLRADLRAAFNSSRLPQVPSDWITLADYFKPRQAIGAGIPAAVPAATVDAVNALAARQLWIESGGHQW